MEAAADAARRRTLVPPARAAWDRCVSTAHSRRGRPHAAPRLARAASAARPGRKRGAGVLGGDVAERRAAKGSRNPSLIAICGAARRRVGPPQRRRKLTSSARHTGDEALPAAMRNRMSRSTGRPIERLAPWPDALGARRSTSQLVGARSGRDSGAASRRALGAGSPSRTPPCTNAASSPSGLDEHLEMPREPEVVVPR